MNSRFGLYGTIVFFFAFALSLERGVFYSRYEEVFASASFSELAYAFLLGLRFDLSTAATMLSPFILAIFFPGVSGRKKLLKALIYLLLLWQVFMLGYNYGDILYFSFTQRHITFEFGNLGGDIGAIFAIAVKGYGSEIAVVLLAILAYAIIFLFLAMYCISERKKTVSIYGQSDILSSPVAYVILIIFSTILIRGGFQMKPLGIKNAFQNEKVELGLLSLNGVYTTFNTVYNSYKGRDPLDAISGLSIPKDEAERFFLGMLDAGETADPEYPLYRRYNFRPEERKKSNVVIFVMESWSSKFSRLLGAPDGGLNVADALPNFDKLARNGFLSYNCFANAQRSVEGLAAVIGSLPSWKGMMLGKGGLLYQTRMRPSGEVFSDLGYNTMFIHGADPGSMGFDGLAKRLGFKSHISKKDFELTSENSDGVWGVYDEYAFLRANEEFKKMASQNSPFFSVVFSLTSHSPYTFPEGRIEKFDESTPFAEFLNSLKYSDYALGRFFEEAEKEEYYKNTLFIIVGDHAEGASTSGSLYESYRVPLLFFWPGVVAPGEIWDPVSQLDIIPSIMQLLKISEPYTSWGKSVFSSPDREMLLPRGNLFVFESDGKMLISDLENPKGLYDNLFDPTVNIIRDEEGALSRDAEDLFYRMKRYLRLSYNLIADNRVAPPKRRTP